VSRLAENPTISEETIRALAGHVSREMLSRYAHIRAQAKRAAIASLEQASDHPEPTDFRSDSSQNHPQLTRASVEQDSSNAEKLLN